MSDATTGLANSGGGTATAGWTNSGTIEARNGGTLTLAGTWSNTNGTINVADPVRTIAASPAGATQSGSTVTITTTAAHGFAVGQNVVIAGVGVAGYNGIFTIATVPSATTFTYTGVPTGLAASGGGTASVINSRVNLGGTFTTAGLGTFTRTDGIGGSVNLTGTLHNAGATLRLGTAARPGSWNMAGGTISGGTVTAAAGTGLVGGTLNGGTLAGVTLDGSGVGDNPRPLDLSPLTTDVSVTGNLTLKGATLPLGNVVGSRRGRLLFPGVTPQSILGVASFPGTILLGAHTGNGIDGVGAVLTLGPNLTITGAAGLINSGTVAFHNQGTIIADPQAVGLTFGTIILNGTGWTNDAAIGAQPAGILGARNGGTLNLAGTFTNNGAINNTCPRSTWWAP